MKALEFLKEQKRRHMNMAKTMNVTYFDDELDEAIAELEAMQSRNCSYWEEDEPIEYSRELDQSGKPIPYVKE